MQLQKLLCQDCRALKLHKLLHLAKKAGAYNGWNEKSKRAESEPEKQVFHWTETLKQES